MQLGLVVVSPHCCLTLPSLPCPPCPAPSVGCVQLAIPSLPSLPCPAPSVGGVQLAMPGGHVVSPHRCRCPAPPARHVVCVQVDMSVSFEQVGGLDHYIGALKEMVFLPLLYPELFERFHIQPPRGVLFYGPPGTGLCMCWWGGGVAQHPPSLLTCMPAFPPLPCL